METGPDLDLARMASRFGKIFKELSAGSARKALAVGSTVMPIFSNSVAMAKTRSVSCLRVCPMPKIVTGLSANVATVAKVKNVSEKALKSNVPPRIVDQELTTRARGVCAKTAPHCSATAAKAVSPCKPSKE